MEQLKQTQEIKPKTEKEIEWETLHIKHKFSKKMKRMNPERSCFISLNLATLGLKTEEIL